MAAESLGQSGPPARELVPDLIRTLGDPDAKVRRASAVALGRIDPDRAQTALTQAANSDADEAVRSAAKAAITKR